MEEQAEDDMCGLLLRLGLLDLWKDQRGQDMIEYALLAAAIAVVVAGFLPPAVIPSVSTIFSKITSTMALS
ncbi:MAG: Flp family type IVb pilin [Bryobacteraceae bacterium]